MLGLIKKKLFTDIWQHYIFIYSLFANFDESLRKYVLLEKLILMLMTINDFSRLLSFKIHKCLNLIFIKANDKVQAGRNDSQK